MMSLYITVVIVMLFPCRCLSQATLFQRSTVVRLGVGSSMELACSVTGAINANRGWTGGPGFSTLITNGISTDTSKYTESLQTVDFSLHVHNVVVDDVCGVDYQCYNLFDTSPRVTIVLNSSIFSYVPTGPEIIVQNEVYDTDKKMTILVNLTKVFPEPACTAKLGNKDVTFLSNSYDNGNCGLKSTEISITNETFDCSGNLKIECTVGSNPLTVYDVKPSSCKTAEDSSDIGAIVGGSVGGAVLGIGGILGILCKVYVFNGKKKKEDSDEEQNTDKKDKKKDKKGKKKGSDEEQNKVEHIDERQPKHINSDKKHQKDGINDSLLEGDKPLVQHILEGDKPLLQHNRLPPIKIEETKIEKGKETHENKTK